MGTGANAGGLSRKHILEGIDASLKRLGTDYVDLYQIHRFDPDDADRGDAGGAERRRARRQGALCRRLVDVRVAVRPHDRHRARARADAEFVSMQNYYNLVYREEEREMMQFCAHRRASRSFPGRRWRAAISRAPASARAPRPCAAAPTRSASTLGLGSPQDEAIRERVERGRREARNEAGDRRARLGAVEALRHRADRRRLEAASPRRRGRGDRH